ncbi:MAG TPA: hypothetical protein VJR89_39910 [Polyangiales bacterium]|nr:hypothetical protein [Polyangiales bacterium]
MLLASSTLAHAQDPGASGPRLADAPVRPLHGIFVRAGYGFGGLGNNVIAVDENEDGDPSSEGVVSGMGMASEITVGGAIADNWVLGGGIWNLLVFASNYTQIEGDPSPRDLQRPQTATLVGMLADWRFAPELGLHGQVALGVAALASQHLEDDELDGSRVAFGPGLSFGLGADFWLARNWAVGAMARFTAAAVFEEVGNDDYVQGFFSPSLVLTVAYNE